MTNESSHGGFQAVRFVGMRSLFDVGIKRRTVLCSRPDSVSCMSSHGDVGKIVMVATYITVYMVSSLSSNIQRKTEKEDKDEEEEEVLQYSL